MKQAKKKTLSRLKKNQKVWVLYVNLCTDYISFKIAEARYLGDLKMSIAYPHVVEHLDEDVNYLKLEDIHETELAAYKRLIKILEQKVKNDEHG